MNMAKSGYFSRALMKHAPLARRKKNSQKTLLKLQREFVDATTIKAITNTCVFSAGSIGRQEAGDRSDLDIFVVTSGKGTTKLQEYEIFSEIIHINNRLNFPVLSNDGAYLKIFNADELAKTIGSPQDDHENWFTARMLLLLESKPLFNRERYDKIIAKILKVYFRDAADHDPFKPVFLLNDLLRFWRTLCLNYEQTRHDEERQWRKKNLNLRFSRMLTVFGTVLKLLVEERITQYRFKQICSLSPLERLASGLDDLDSAGALKSRFKRFLNEYEFFLSSKEQPNFDSNEKLIRRLGKKSEDFSEFLYDALNHETIDPRTRRYLVI